MKEKKSLRQKKVEELIRKEASEFINERSNKSSLITVSSVDISPNFSKCDILITVFPEESLLSALNFLKRKRSEFKSHIKKKLSLKKIPFFDFDIDKGELNRQKIEEISAKNF